jgi:hypothetical protein
VTIPQLYDCLIKTLSGLRTQTNVNFHRQFRLFLFFSFFSFREQNIVIKIVMTRGKTVWWKSLKRYTDAKRIISFVSDNLVHSSSACKDSFVAELVPYSDISTRIRSG